MPSISRIILPRTRLWVSYEVSSTARKHIIHCSCVSAGRIPRTSPFEFTLVDLVLLRCIVWMSRVTRRVSDMSLACALLKGSSRIHGMLWFSMVNGDLFNATGEQGLSDRELQEKRLIVEFRHLVMSKDKKQVDPSPPKPTREKIKYQVIEFNTFVNKNQTTHATLLVRRTLFPT